MAKKKIDWKGGFLEKVLQWQKDNKASVVQAAEHFKVAPERIYSAISNAKTGGYMPKINKTKKLKSIDLEIPDAPTRTGKKLVGLIIVPADQLNETLEVLKWQ